MKVKTLLLFSLVTVYFSSCSGVSYGILIEAESFTDKGGWVVDQQFVEQMGSPYLLAHGMGQEKGF